MINLGPVYEIEMVDTCDHQFEAKPTEGTGDAFEHQGNPRERFRWIIAWTGDINPVHDQGIQVDESADKVRHHCSS